ncbi:MAG: hypothetical protein QOH46_2341 [Solirubrobacteraceae bacterium]|jgi:hypothetical protein|nr:hypothetical protein [Solirubrobacteraceae bacterium]
MQHNPLHLEYTRTVAAERSAGGYEVHTHPPPPPQRATRRLAAEKLARLAWRLDREAALRAWP